VEEPQQATVAWTEVVLFIHKNKTRPVPSIPQSNRLVAGFVFFFFFFFSCRTISSIPRRTPIKNDEVLFEQQLKNIVAEQLGVKKRESYKKQTRRPSFGVVDDSAWVPGCRTRWIRLKK